mgnify:CR=1 FL=1
MWPCAFSCCIREAPTNECTTPCRQPFGFTNVHRHASECVSATRGSHADAQRAQVRLELVDAVLGIEPAVRTQADLDGRVDIGRRVVDEDDLGRRFDRRPALGSRGCGLEQTSMQQLKDLGLRLVAALLLRDDDRRAIGEDRRQVALLCDGIVPSGRVIREDADLDRVGAGCLLHS